MFGSAVREQFRSVSEIDARTSGWSRSESSSTGAQLSVSGGGRKRTSAPIRHVETLAASRHAQEARRGRGGIESLGAAGVQSVMEAVQKEDGGGRRASPPAPARHRPDRASASAGVTMLGHAVTRR